MITPRAFELRGVCKAFRFFQIQDLSFELEAGQIMGFVGPNGAGKTTTLRMLMGLTPQDAGEISLLGFPMPAQSAVAKRDVGFVAADMRLFGNATVAWHMRFVASIYPTWDADYAAALLKRFNLHADQAVKSLSLGEHVKATLLLALARRPRLLVLDEPTSGLDPVARHEMLTEVTAIMRDEQRSVLFSSHNTQDVERICDSITFIDRGRLVESRDKESFLESWRRIELRVPQGVVLPRTPGVIDISVNGQNAVVTARDYSEDLPALYTHAGASVQAVQRMTLEEIFVASVMHSRGEAA